MKTAKEKALEILKKFEDENYFDNDSILENAKFNSIIAIDLIIDSWNEDGNKGIISYWNEVKSEIQTL